MFVTMVTFNSRPGTGGFKPRAVSGLVHPGDQARTPAASKQSGGDREEDGEEDGEEEEDSSEDETSENSSHNSDESFSELSSSRAVSPPREDA